MFINKKIFNENKKTITVLLIVVLGFLVLSFFLPKDQKLIPEGNLNTNIDSKLNKLVINEVMSSNGGVLAAPTGELYDWVEFYNGKDHDINLSSYGLSDEPNRVKWSFPDVTIKAKSYLIVYLAGNEIEGLYANFALRSGGGETLSLRNPNGKVIDAFKTEKIKKNNSFIRDENGKWLSTDKPTPGHDNSLEGYDKYVESLTVENNGLEITEVLPRNLGNYIGEDNQLYGFIEITNKTGQEINLENYSVSNSLSIPFRAPLPKYNLKNKESVALYTTNGVTLKKELSVDFNLKNKNGEVVLSNNEGKIVDVIKYNNLPSGMSLTKIEGKLKESSVVSPGYISAEDYQSNKLKNKEDLIINEVMNTNTSFIAQNGNQFYDLIELKNNTNKDINLKDYKLSNDLDNLSLYNLPDKVLKPNQIIVLIASGNEKYTNANYYHTNFKLSKKTGLYLIKDNKFIDTMFISNIKPNQSFGRNQQSGFFYFEKPTPGEENNSGYREISFEPEILTSPGVFNKTEGITYKVSSVGKTYFTTDGSIPTEWSKELTEDLKLTETTVIKTRTFEAGKMPSTVVTSTYIVNENHTLPVISVSLDSSDFDYINRNNWETGLKVPAYAEFYEEGKNFSIPCGLKLFGGSSRGDSKKSFALKFKKEYGEAHLDYKVFDNRESNIYDTIVIRSGSQDYPEAMIRDELATSLANESKTTTQDYKATILYINGEYWGIYFLKEKVDDDFISNKYNVSPDGTNIVRIDSQVAVGSANDYNNLLSYVSNNDLSLDKHYEHVETILNIDSVIDFWIGQLYTANNDIVNQRYYNNPAVDNNRIHMIFYDIDFGFYNYKYNYLQFMTSSEGMTVNGFSTTLLRNLMKNKKFRNRFVERLSYNLTEIWTDKKINNKIDELTNLIAKEMPRNQKRWNLTEKDWEEGLDELKYFVQERRKYLLPQIKSFFYLSDKEMSDYFGV